MSTTITLLNYSTTMLLSTAVKGGHFGEEGMMFPYKNRKLAAKALKRRKLAAKKVARKHRKHHTKTN
ncbi:hypothetical protein ANCCAN_09152 [Ancylostoma caninum]|uniref:Uncharacterized protein n=1 Tax=Ancylostoma caninum TaxID=29170 RepID=A0A368GP15_ANCCA|nr:hypothetical protein ANCCAN_09152 [Ancylostoma caninum]